MRSVASVDGMRDFFGKKLGGWVWDHVAHMSPVDLSQKVVRANLGRAMNSGGFQEAGAVAAQTIRKGLKANPDYRIGDWFAGISAGETADTLSSSLRRSRVAMRVGIPALAGVATASTLVAPGNPLDTVSRTGLEIGAHSAVAGALGNRLNPWLGAGYAGLSAMNMLRPGNNLGPF